MTATSNPFPLASEKPYGDDSTESGTDAGASGSSDNSVGLSTGGMIALIVVVVVVVIFGAFTATLFFIAKKREWTMRETIRRSARKVATVLTPRRSEFPRSVKELSPSSSTRNIRGRANDVPPPTPRIRPEDLEKGLDKAKAKRQQKKWGR